MDDGCDQIGVPQQLVNAPSMNHSKGIEPIMKPYVFRSSGGGINFSNFYLNPITWGDVLENAIKVSKNEDESDAC